MEMSPDEVSTFTPDGALDFLRDPTAPLPPSTFEVDGQIWNLISAMEVNIAEMDVSSPPIELGSGLDVEGPSRTVVRTIQMTDLTYGSSRTIRYAEVSLVALSRLAWWQTPVLPTSKRRFRYES